MTAAEQERLKQYSADNGKLVKGVFCDAYNFYLKYHGRPMEPGTWERETQEFADMMKKYNGASICGRIMLATFSQLEEEQKR